MAGYCKISRAPQGYCDAANDAILCARRLCPSEDELPDGFVWVKENKDEAA